MWNKQNKIVKMATFLILAMLALLAIATVGKPARCLYGVCIGAPAPSIGEFEQVIRSQTADGQPVLIVDIVDRAPFVDLVHFRPEFKTPSGIEKIAIAQLRIGEDVNGHVDRLQLSVEFTEGSYLWSPNQQQRLSEEFNKMLGNMGSFQSVNWMRLYTWHRLDRLGGTRTVAQVWPGTGGAAAIRIDMGTTDRVSAPVK